MLIIQLCSMMYCEGGILQNMRKYVATTMQRISMYSSSMHRELAKSMEMSGIEPEAFRMRNGGSTTELHPPSPL